MKVDDVLNAGRDLLQRFQGALQPIDHDFWQPFWASATRPLHYLTLQSGLLVALVILLAWLITRIVRSATWRFAKPIATGLEIMTTHHTTADKIALSPEEYIRAFASDPNTLLSRNTTRVSRLAWGAERHKREQHSYFVFTLVQRDDPQKTPRFLGTPVLTKEMQVWRKSNPPREGLVQLDLASLREVRDRNNSSSDDDDGVLVEGHYDLYMRRVRWWDIRHWLVHPNREIRIAIWVTIISTVVPSVLGALFAPPPAQAEFTRATIEQAHNPP